MGQPQHSPVRRYVYNRLEGEDARLVSYHLGANVEVLERSPGLSTLVAGFDAAPD